MRIPDAEGAAVPVWKPNHELLCYIPCDRPSQPQKDLLEVDLSLVLQGSCNIIEVVKVFFPL